MKKNTAGQKWRDIPGFEGKYQANETGDILSLKRKNRRSDRILKQHIAHDGYMRVKIAFGKKGHSQDMQAHRLIALAFLGKPDDERNQVNHIDGNKTNNHTTNLEWVTSKENHSHAIRTGLRKCCGENNGQSKLVESQVREIILSASGQTNRSLAKCYGVSGVLIGKIRARTAWKHVEVTV